MRKIFNKLLNIAIFGLAIFAFDMASERLVRMGQITRGLTQQVGYSGPMAGIPSGMPDNIDW
ncbi:MULTISPECIES: hypothetical protein [Xanthomonas]|uniref:Uncharacterized protein n=1 Tax=Xanthomonas dyei TaxID=743699 RepID=A0ABZ0DD81_9XANT|nr:hypothetical protein [Xanthomonas dyei]WOB27747.1 hypothetical protein NYR99_07415 [Xanthomonas dyei]WOB55369.1 hypothetical protein NYR95_07420 [Xanthomonas dyei]